ncbi:MAG: DUF418 domain-containing protein [Coriobacteriia bacterium]|nr:DUF418 domain-containing protein [Coriobacteriia bacterium]
MARRSPTNPRYQKHTSPEGKTRKSAAAAKPKKSSASSSKSSTSATKKSTSALALKNPDTPEFKAARRIWWITLVVGLALTAASYALGAYVKTGWSRNAQAITLGLAYAAIIYAFYIDWTKMRPMRKASYEAQKSGKAPKPEKVAKEDKQTSDGKDA